MIVHPTPFRLHIELVGSEEELKDTIKRMKLTGWIPVGGTYYRQTVDSHVVAQLFMNSVPEATVRVLQLEW